MGSLIVTTFLSLDGVMENPMWTIPYWNDEIAAFKGEETSSGEALLLGRITYEGFAAAWPQRSNEDDPGAAYFNSTRKYVVSTTLQTADWNNSVLIRSSIVQEIARLKQENSSDLVVHGSATLVQTLMQHNLVDRYRLLIYPVVLGQGKQLFQDGATATLRLVEARSFSSGVTGLIYAPADRQ
ncbi:MAG: pyrimidine reductase [Phototrophicales bacterium]|nr:MAG: pyrimidine reductase [Phototrophicales bacterium]